MGIVNALLLCAAATVLSPAQTVTTLFSFDGSDGAVPYAGLIQGIDGNLYGTTSDDGEYLSGTVFEISPSGALTTLYSFCSQSHCADGKSPVAGLVQAANGDLYGTDLYGGSTHCMHGCGTVFKVTPSGTLTTLHGFCSQSGCPDGNNPVAGLVPSDNGDFYGMTCCGGANGYGTVFRISPSGAFTTLYDFCSQRGCADGWGSRRALVQASDGDFYGTTYYGGIGGTSGAGTVFKVDPSGALRTVYRFCSDRFCAHGEHPDAGLVQATDGDFYGTTVDGGTNNGNGTVFKISPGGKLTRLYSFCAEGGCSDGYNPGGLIQATDGDF